MSVNFDGKIREKIIGYDRTDTTSSNESKTKSKTVGAHVSFSDDDIKKLQRKREKEGWCIMCGEVKTHKKVLIRMVPETVHGLVYQGVCLRCNPSPNIEGCRLSYGNLRLGWERAIRATDFKFKWEPSHEPSNDCFNTAYVRKVEFLSMDSGEPRVGRVSLVTAEDSVSESLVECAYGRTLVSFNDIEKAQKMNLEGKKQWFYGVCARLSMPNESQVLISVSQNHVLDDSIKAVMSLNQADLRKKWVVARDTEVGEMSLDSWYTTVIDELFSSDSGLWEKCAGDETRFDIKFMRDMVGGSKSSGDGDYLALKVREYVSQRFRFIGRILGKALLDGKIVRGCRLASHLYMLILGMPIMLHDLKHMDVQYHIYLRSLMTMFPQESRETSNTGISSLGLNFSISEKASSPRDDMVPLAPNSLIDMIPLVPNGDLIAVDDENLPEYIKSVMRYRLFGRHEVQLESFLLGFLEVVPEPLLAVFDHQELEALLCGSYTGLKTPEEDESLTEHEVSTVTMSTGFEQPLNAIAKLLPRRTESTSSRSAAATLPEALLVDAALYDAVAEPMETADNSSKIQESEVKYRLKKGRCVKCGMQTHKQTGVLKKNLCPLSNENVLNGRCLFCNPIKVNTGDQSCTGKTSVSDFSLPPPTAPSYETCPSPIDSDGRQEGEVGGIKARSQDEVQQWLVSRLPSLQKQDIDTYSERLVEDGFDSIAMMDHLEEEDLGFMKKAHKRALMKSL
jgi:hypothetical protein